MSKRAIFSKNAPEAIGPYSQAVVFGDFVFVSGQIPLRKDGTLVSGDFEKEVKQVFNNISEILKEENLNFSNILMVNVYLKDIGLFSKLNEIYKEYFSPPFPSRAVVEVSKLPKDVRVETSVIAGK